MITSTLLLLSVHLLGVVYSTNTSHCMCAPANSLICDEVLATDTLASHDRAGLHDECLHSLNVPANTMKCFRWGHKKCQEGFNVEDKCKLIFQDEFAPELEDMDSNGRTRVFQSPGFNRQRGAKNRHFCVYNISLNCSGHHANLYTTEGTSRSNDPTWRSECRDYVKFYTNSTTEADLILCGEKFGHFDATLNSNNFIAILWTDRIKSLGKFQMVASCGSAIVPTPSPNELQDQSSREAC